MKRLNSIAMVVLALLLCAAPVAAYAEPVALSPLGDNLTLDDVRELSQKGESITLQDLERFYGEKISPEPIVIHYPLDDCSVLVACSTGMTDPVQYAKLFKHGLDTGDDRLCVDIRTGDIDAYLKEDTAGPLVEWYLATMKCQAACTYVVAIIDAHPQERDAILKLDYRALPTLSKILNTKEHSMRVDMVEVLVDDILSRRVLSAFASEETVAFESAANAALITYSGHAYKPHPPNPKWNNDQPFPY